VELERLRRELAYRKQLNEQQNNMISQQRAQLAMGQDEMNKIDNRILELQERLSRKRMINQQLANQINEATSAKQAQLRAIQHGINKNKNKPVSTVEPFQRQITPEEEDNKNKVGSNEDPKYQTLPFGTKFGANGGGLAAAAKNKAQKLEKETTNDNAQFSNHDNLNNANRLLADRQGNFSEPNLQKPVSSVAPVSTTSSLSQLTAEPGGKPKPALPPKPLVGKNGSPPAQPPPYIPAPPPEAARNSNGGQPPPTSVTNSNLSEANLDDSSITIRDSQQSYQGSTLSVAGGAHSEEGTSVDDDPPSPEVDKSQGAIPRTTANLSLNLNSNVHISINRRIEMPPAFHFPEDQVR
jgi:hypothetical protein